MADEAAGRGRGRARGRPAGPLGESSPEQGGGDSPTGGNGSMRGRGGLRPGHVLCTIPAGITTTVGEDPNSKPVQLISNYIRIKAPTDVIVFRYRVDFDPEVEAVFVRRGMLSDQKTIFGGAYIFDGGSDLMSTTDLGSEPKIISAIRKSDQRRITITVKKTGDIPWSSSEMLRLFNTQMRRNFSHMKYMMIGRHFFNPNEGRILLQGWNLQIWKGINTAVNLHDGGTFMVADTVHKIIRSDTVYDILHQCLQKDRGNFKDAARRELVGSVVLTQYNNKTYRIDEIDFDKNPMDEFEKKGVKVSIKNYYKTQYNIEIRDAKQPLIVCRPSVKERRRELVSGSILLVPELCVMTGLTDSLKSDFNLKKEMSQKTQLVPNKRISELYNLLRTMDRNEEVKRDMDTWRLKLDENLVSFPARTLPCEKIYMYQESDSEGVFFDQKSGDFSKEIRGKEMKRRIQINTWSIISTQRDQHIVDQFTSTLKRVLLPLGCTLANPSLLTIENDRVATFVQTCKSLRDQQMVLVIVPNNNKDRYDAIKKIFCCEQPVASQVILFRNLSKKQMMMSLCTKVGIQMACKLGAEPWGLRIPVRIKVLSHESSNS